MSVAATAATAVEDPPDDWELDSAKEDHQEDSKTIPSQAQHNRDVSQDDSDEDDISQDSQILAAYRKLLSRRVDLVGDYAGDELFIIDGDSLLLRAFSDATLDFEQGFQMLHATYNVETFLGHLLKRKCNFHIVFFDSNEDLCVPLSAKVQNHCKYLLARTAIVRHLQTSLPKTYPTVMVKSFAGYGSDSFGEYLRETGPYFVMLHDGAETVQRQRAHADKDLGPDHQRVLLRRMVLWFIGQGYNVALLNGLEWRDTKVITTIMETRQLLHEIKATDPKPTSAARPSFDVASELAKLSDFELTPRQQLAALAASKLIKDPLTDEGDIPQLCCIFLLHEAYLHHLPLAHRRMPKTAGAKGAQGVLRAFAAISATILPAFHANEDQQQPYPFFVDYIDGRLFLSLSDQAMPPNKTVGPTFSLMLKAVEVLSGSQSLDATTFAAPPATPSTSSSPDERVPRHELAVLPFSNPVFDKHLESVHLVIDDTVGAEESVMSHRIFQELTHWHNAKKPLIQKGAPSAASEKAAFWAAKREQLFMAEMRTYAASLTNAVGKILEPETIIVGAQKAAVRDSSTEPGRTALHRGSETSSPADSDGGENAASNKPKAGSKKSGGGKTAQKNAGKQAMLAQIAASKAKKEESVGDKIAAAWHTVCKFLEGVTDIPLRYRKTKEHLVGLTVASRDVVEAEIKLYELDCVLQYWLDVCRRQEQNRHIEVTALIWSLAREVIGSRGVTKSIATCVELTVNSLKLPVVGEVSSSSLPDRKLGFTFALPTKVSDIAIKISSKEFQMTYCGPYLERSFDSRPDARVEFNPDGWQRKVLDAIDANQSVFAVAPTSAGKTFISFYAMRKVLEHNDDDVLVYVAPTKALVNQIAAEIQARYSKKFKHGGKSVWAIHTRDYRINNPTGCQVLVTVPHVLQIMLLAPSNANSWSSRVRRIIFDEVHSIGQAEDGVVWEQLLLMAPCPIIALSATVGNPEEFSTWLTDTQRAIGVDLVTVIHPYRYSDLRKYFYQPPETFAFLGLPEKRAFGTLGLDRLAGFRHVHPVAGLIDRSRGVPQDLGLESRDCLDLWKVMMKHQTADYPVPADLTPHTALPAVSRKADVLAWESRLKELLKKWIDDRASPYDAVVNGLAVNFRDTTREPQQLTQTTKESVTEHVVEIDDSTDLYQTTLPMLCRLHAQDALPAILFNFDRHQCEKISEVLLMQLEEAELKLKKSGPRWEKTLERWGEWKKLQEKMAAKQPKVSGKKAKGQDEEKGSRLDQQRDASENTPSSWESFNPDAPQDGFHFADYTKVQLSELETYIRQLNRRNIPQVFIKALERGIGVHHAGVNRKLRQVVEILFRKGFLRVVIATGTLALGINMPCKTVVFSGDSVFLTALNYRQCAGRAGRRGFDLLGNVVFQGLSRAKVCRLISSRLPSLNGHFPLTTTLVLRLFTLLHESKNAKYAVSAVNALLSQPRMYMGGPSFKDQTMHHLRFSIEYLRRQHLLAPNGAPLNFAGLVSHLYFTENSSFAFHALLKEGYFHELCGRIRQNEKHTVETLMLVMAHLFKREYCRQSDAEYREKVVKPSSSLVFLPPLPKPASDILRAHGQETLEVYRTYIETFVEQHIHEPDTKLPLTGLHVGGDHKSSTAFGLPAVKVRSPFVALSGKGDEFDSIADLCQTTRDGVFLEQAVVPHVATYPEELDVPLNAWLLDFFKHGDVMTIEKANGIRRSDIWFGLNDFSLIVATIIASLLNFLKLKEGSDMDMLDVMGDLDVHDEAEDNEIAASEEQSVVSGPSVADSVMSMHEKAKPLPMRKAKNAESWEEVDDAELESQRREDRRAANAARLESAVSEALVHGVGGSGEGLKDVLRAFQKLHAEFNVKFRAMWA